jgi:hypothetical protein
VIEINSKYEKYIVYDVSLTCMINKLSSASLTFFCAKIKDWCVSVTINTFLAIIEGVVSIAFQNVHILGHLIEDVFF